MISNAGGSLLDQLGVLGYPLLICGSIILAIVLERTLFFLMTFPLSGKAIERLIDKKMEPLSSDPGKVFGRNRFGSLFLELYQKRQLPKQEREDYCAIRLIDVEHSLTRFLPLLKILATISPLLGLLGTVLGMINSFELISIVNKPITPALVSGGISQALLTTAFGLILAISALVPFSLFQLRAQRLMQRLTQQLNLVSLHLQHHNEEVQR